MKMHAGFIFAAALVSANPAHALQRAFVASYGNDANTASGCLLANPCRGFAAAMTVVDPGGEIIALDAAGYAPVTINKSVTITANPGFYAGISVATGDGVTIATASVVVTLRGLNINGIGGAKGVNMTNGNRLSIENCVISNFTSDGVFVNSTAKVRVADSLIRDNGHAGVYLQGGATGDVVRSIFLGNADFGVTAEGNVGATLTTVNVSDSMFNGNTWGVGARGHAGNARASRGERAAPRVGFHETYPRRAAAVGAGLGRKEARGGAASARLASSAARDAPDRAGLSPRRPPHT